MTTVSRQLNRQLTALMTQFSCVPSPLLVAVSGGQDSMALLYHLMQQQATYGYTLHVVHINHHLRAQSADEEQLVRTYCQQHQLPLTVTHWTPPTKSANIELLARQYRYAQYAAVLDDIGGQIVCTAHHRDDQAETVLMRLVRGDKLDSLAAMQTLRPLTTGVTDKWVWRPLLELTKRQLSETITQHHIPFLHDASNDNSDYTRNRFRNQVLPLLQTENPQVVAHLSQFAEQMAERTALVHALTAPLLDTVAQWAPDGACLNVTDLLQYEPVVQRELVAQWLYRCQAQFGIVIQMTQVQQCQHILQRTAGHARVDLADDWQLSREYGIAQLRRVARQVCSGEAAYQLVLNGDAVSDETIRAQLVHEQQDPAIDFPVPYGVSYTVRKRQAGDRIQLSDTLNKKLSRYFIDAKVPYHMRDAVYLAVDETGMVRQILSPALSIRIETDKMLYIRFEDKREILGDSTC